MERSASPLEHSSITRNKSNMDTQNNLYESKTARTPFPTPPWEQKLPDIQRRVQPITNEGSQGLMEIGKYQQKYRQPGSQQQIHQQQQQQINLQQTPKIPPQHMFQTVQHQSQSQMQPNQYVEQNHQQYPQQVYHPSHYFLPHVMKEIPVH